MWRRRTGQLFTEQEAHNLGDAGLVCLTRGLDLAVFVPLVQRRFKIVTDSLEVARTKGFNPRAFGGFEDGSGTVQTRAEFAMGRFVVMRQPQGRCIGRPAQACALLRRRPRWQRRKPDIRLADMGVGSGIGHLMLDTAADGTHRRCGRFQELLVRIAARHWAEA